MELSNYSLVVLKIAKKSACLCVFELGALMALLASALPWQPGFHGERLPFFKCFLALSKTSVHGGGDNFVLFVARYVIMDDPTLSLNYTKHTKGTESNMGLHHISSKIRQTLPYCRFMMLPCDSVFSLGVCPTNLLCLSLHVWLI